MIELVKRLRLTADNLQPGSEPEVSLRVAADAIERLTRERDEARAKFTGWSPHACKVIRLCECGQNWVCQICGEGAGSSPCGCAIRRRDTGGER